MLLELITGRKPVDTKHTYMDDSLVDWARPLLTRALEERNISTLVDEKLQNDYDHDAMLRMVSCAAASVRHSARRRPRMSEESAVAAAEGRPGLTLSGSDDIRSLTLADFKYAHEKVCASVTSESAYMTELQQWNELYSEGGSRRKKALSYFMYNMIVMIAFPLQASSIYLIY